jgi:hypothetical protein
MAGQTACPEESLARGKTLKTLATVGETYDDRHPSFKHYFRGSLNPLVTQGGNFFAQIRRMIEASQLKTLPNGPRSGIGSQR